MDECFEQIKALVIKYNLGELCNPGGRMLGASQVREGCQISDHSTREDYERLLVWLENISGE